MLLLCNGFQNGVDAIVQIGAIGARRTGLPNGFAAGFLVGKLFAKLHATPHRYQHQGIVGPQGIIDGIQAGTLLILLELAHAAGGADNAVVGYAQLRPRNRNHIGRDFLPVCSDADIAPFQGDANQINMVTGNHRAGIQQLLWLCSGGNRKGCTQQNTKQQCRNSFHKTDTSHQIVNG